jgi:hypothetical protein
MASSKKPVKGFQQGLAAVGGVVPSNKSKFKEWSYAIEFQIEQDGVSNRIGPVVAGYRVRWR